MKTYLTRVFLCLLALLTVSCENPTVDTASTMTPLSEKAITALSFPALNNVSAAVDETTFIVSITVPHGTDVTSLTPTIIHTGESISPTSAQDFSSPVSYTVRAADGSTQIYQVSVTVAENSAKAITALSFPTLSNATVAINKTAHTIHITVPHGTDVTSLTPTIIHTGASISPTSAQDFSSPVSYTVRAADGSTQAYQVSVIVAENSAKAITALSFPTLSDANVAIDEAAHTISITVPHGTDVTSLTPTITHTGASVSPTSAQDFSSPVSYTVRAADGSTQVYHSNDNCSGCTNIYLNLQQSEGKRCTFPDDYKRGIGNTAYIANQTWIWIWKLV